MLSLFPHGEAKYMKNLATSYSEKVVPEKPESHDLKKTSSVHCNMYTVYIYTYNNDTLCVYCYVVRQNRMTVPQRRGCGR